MSAYTPGPGGNGYDNALIPIEVRNKYFEEVLLLSPLSAFMGDSPESVIQVLYKKDGTGPTSTFAFSREIDYKNTVMGYDQISGKGQNLAFYEDTITVNQQALVDVIKGIQLTQLTTPIDIYNAMKPKLQNAHKRNIVYSLLKAATSDYCNAAGQIGTSGPVSSRAIYGVPGVTNYDANPHVAIAAMTGSTFDTAGLSVAGIRALRDLAITGGQGAGSFEAEKRISPYMLKTRDGFPSPFYVYFMDTASYASLQKDDAWKSFYNRGVIEMPNQPSSLVGSFFKGQIDNVLIYEVPELGNFQQTATNTVSWNLFCGAQAFGLMWHKQPWFTQEFTNHDTVVEMAMIEHRGQKAIKFPSFANTAVNIENGIIHHFVQIA